MTEITVALLKKVWPYLVAFAIGAILLGGAAWKIQGLRVTAAEQKTTRVQQAFDKFALDTYNTGLKAEAKRLRDEADQLKNLKKVQADHEKQIPTIRARAVANYLAAHSMPDDSGTSTGSGSVRGDGAGIRLDDDAKRQCLPDEAFIRDAAEDAAKLEAWQRYCRMNRCPITD